MPRMYPVQAWFSLSDEGAEDVTYDSYALRKFMGMNILTEQVSDAAIWGAPCSREIKDFMDKTGHITRGGRIVDATIINAPSATKNAEHVRGPEMYRAKKGNEWRFGMKIHVGVDAGTGAVVSVEATAANVRDVAVASKLLREDNTVAYGDSGHLGTEKRPEITEDEHLSKMEDRINRRPGKPEPEAFH